MERGARRGVGGWVARGLRLSVMLAVAVCRVGPSMADDRPSVLQKIAATKRITIGFRTGYPPYSDMLDGNLRVT